MEQIEALAIAFDKIFEAVEKPRLKECPVCLQEDLEGYINAVGFCSRCEEWDEKQLKKQSA